MSSAITFKDHGFWLSNTLCKNVYYYIRDRVKSIKPELYGKLPKEDNSTISWVVTGMCPDLDGIIEILDSKELLEKALEVDEPTLESVAQNNVDITDLKKAINATRLLLREEIKLKLSDESAYLHKMTNL